MINRELISFCNHADVDVWLGVAVSAVSRICGVVSRCESNASVACSALTFSGVVVSIWTSVHSIVEPLLASVSEFAECYSRYMLLR